MSYNIYKNKTTPTIDTLHEKMKDISAGTNSEFTYKRNILYDALQMLCFKYQRVDY